MVHLLKTVLILDQSKLTKKHNKNIWSVLQIKFYLVQLKAMVSALAILPLYKMLMIS